MRTPEQYRSYAAAALRNATKPMDAASKSALTDIARGWLDLADTAEAQRRLARTEFSPRKGGGRMEGVIATAPGWRSGRLR